MLGWSFNGTSSGGLAGTFDTPLLLGVIGMLIILGIGAYKRAPLDLMATASVAFLSVLSGAYLPSWTFWIFIIGGGAVAALGLLKFFKIR